MRIFEILLTDGISLAGEDVEEITGFNTAQPLGGHQRCGITCRLACNRRALCGVELVDDHFEEHGRITPHHVPVGLLSVELEGEYPKVAFGVDGSPFTATVEKHWNIRSTFERNSLIVYKREVLSPSLAAIRREFGPVIAGSNSFFPSYSHLLPDQELRQQSPVSELPRRTPHILSYLSHHYERGRRLHRLNTSGISFLISINQPWLHLFPLDSHRPLKLLRGLFGRAFGQWPSSLAEAAQMPLEPRSLGPFPILRREALSVIHAAVHLAFSKDKVASHSYALFPQQEIKYLPICTRLSTEFS